MSQLKLRGRHRLATLTVPTFVLLGLMLPTPAGATPSYGRRFGVSCNTCHSPLPPRLNNFGMVFRRLGFRMPDSDEDGKLLIKSIPAHGIGDAASLSANVAFHHDQTPEEGSSSTFSLGEVELVAGTAIGDSLSTQVMFVPWNDDGEVELEDAELQFNAGNPRHQFMARGGLMQTLYWQKANHGALTQSVPLIFDESAVQGVGDFAGFGLGRKLIGVEAGYLFSKLNDGRLTSTMASVGVYNGVNQEGERTLRNTTGGADVLVQVVQLFGLRNTFGAFYYRGRTALESTGEPTVRFDRYGVTGNYLLFKRLDIVAGVVLGKDRDGLLGTDVKMGGLYGELSVDLMKRWIGVYRFDLVDPDRDQTGDTVRDHVLSTTFQATEHLYLTAEYRRLHQPAATNNSVVVNLRLVY